MPSARNHLTILVMAASITFAGAQVTDRLSKLQSSFIARYDELNQEAEKAQKSLSSGYLEALARLQEKLQKSGRIETVLPVIDEIAAIKTASDPLPELGAGATVELKQLREKFITSRNAARQKYSRDLAGISGKMIALLEEETKTLTKAGKIEEALAATKMAESLANDPKIAEAKAASDKKPTISTGNRDWLPFDSAKLKVLDSKYPYIGKINAAGYETVHAQVRKTFDAVDDGKNTLWAMLAPAKIELKFERKVSELKASALSCFSGPSSFTVTVNGKIVKELSVQPGIDKQGALDCKFEPSDRITIEVKELAVGGNWTALIDPKVR